MTSNARGSCARVCLCQEQTAQLKVDIVKLEKRIDSKLAIESLFKTSAAASLDKDKSQQELLGQSKKLRNFEVKFQSSRQDIALNWIRKPGLFLPLRQE
jgi:hypothetical protein